MDGIVVNQFNPPIESGCAESTDRTPRFGPSLRLLVLLLCGAAAIVLTLNAGPRICASVVNGPGNDELLRLAAAQGDLPAVEQAIANGASVNAVDTGGITPLIGAALAGRVETVQELLNRGATVSPMSDGGMTALRAAVGFNGNVEIVRMLLEHGANPNQCAPGQCSTLSIARELAGDQAIVDELIAHGAVASEDSEAKASAPAGD